MDVSDDDNVLNSLKETPSTKIAWSYLLTKYLDAYGKAMLTRSISDMDNLLDYIESLISNELTRDNYYERVETFRRDAMKSAFLSNPTTTEEEVAVSKTVMFKVLKYRFKLIMQNIHKSGFTFSTYVDES